MAIDQDLADFVRRGIRAQDAADRARGGPTAVEIDQTAEIECLCGQLAAALDAALADIGTALRALDELRSPSVYDVDAAEGHTGGDIAAFLDTARRDVSAARALAGAALSVNVGAGE